MKDSYTAQVCRDKGHRISDPIELYPEDMQNYCQICGSTTITSCPSCGAPLRSTYDDGVVGEIEYTYDHCHNCGNPYPWTEKGNKKEPRNYERKNYHVAVISVIIAAISIVISLLIPSSENVSRDQTNIGGNVNIGGDVNINNNTSFIPPEISNDSRTPTQDYSISVSYSDIISENLEPTKK